MVCHQNIASIDKKAPKIEVLLKSKLACDVLALTEHWLCETKLRCIHIDGYKLISYFCRKLSAHGGSCIYVKSGIKCVENRELVNCSIERYCEVSAVDLIDYKLTIVCIYRTNLVSAYDFFTRLEGLLDKISQLELECVIVGDFNINCIGTVCSDQKRLIDLLSTHDMTNLVGFPTRITMHSSTCLDHLYTNLSSDHVSTSPVTTHLSDHLAVRAELIRRASTTSNTARDRLVRNFSRINLQNFVFSLESVDWNDVIQRNSTSYDKLTMAIINVISNKILICFPFKQVIQRVNPSWVSPDIENFRLLLFDFIDIRNNNTDIEFINNLITDLNIRYDNLIKQERSKFYTRLIVGSKNTSKSMWGIINEQRGKSNNSNIDFTDIIKNVDGQSFSTKRDLVNKMNARFVGAAVACGAPQADPARVRRTLSAARAPADRSLRLRPFTAAEVFCIITKQIPPKPSKDAYGVSMKLLNIAATSMSSVLAELFNLCFRNGVYPGPLKLSKVSPLFKGKGKRQDIDGYRPVSIIPAIAKVFENGISSRLIDYLSSANSLSDRQYAYRAGRSTTCLTREVVRRVLDARERKLHVAVLCCDLSKAFDVADHTILAIKLQHYGIYDKALSMLRDMMQGRSQVVVGGGGLERSDPLSLTMGVAQGSAVSNILFSLLLNDLPDAVNAAEVFMYADDVAAVVTAPSTDQLEQQLNSAACQLATWFCENGLVLNLSKTHYMHFCLGGRRPRDLQVSANGTRLEACESTTFLGFELDRALTWESHVDKVCGRLGSACFALYRLSRFLPESVVRSCYFATVHSVLQYGAELWGRSSDWLRAFRMQKRAVRAVARIPQDSSARPFFKSLGILTLPSILIYQVAVYVRLNLVGYKTNGDKHSYSTRRARKLSSISCKLAKSIKLTHVMGPAVYNRLPEDVTEAPSLSCFKLRLKRWLIEQTFYNFDDFVSIKPY